MTTAPSASPELQKLAHTLGVPVTDLTMLDGVPDADLRELRAQTAEALFQADRPAFARVAALSKTVPAAVSAKITELALPPLLAARTAELLEPAKAADMVGRVSDRYLADVSAAMDATRAPEVVAAIPAAKVATVAAELAKRKEWVVIGGFVSVVAEPALRASVAVYDGEQLLRIGYVLDDLARLDDISGMLTDVQRDALIAAAAEHQLWSELSTLLDNLAAPRIAKLAERYAAAPEAVRKVYEQAAADGDLPAADLARVAGT